MPIEDKIRECPFCGSEAVHHWPNGDGKIQCTGCRANMWVPGINYLETPWLSLAAWNTRAGQASVSGRE